MISKLFAPIVWFLSISTNNVLRLIGIDPNEEEEHVSEEEIRMMIDVGTEKGTIDYEEKELIQNVFEFDDLTAEEIATHRMEVEFLWMKESMEEWEKTIHKTRHTLYPVYGDSTDHIIGILNAKDYFRLEDKSRESVIRAIKPAYFVPENIKADVLFRNMKRSHSTLAVVLDEYGGMVGIVTLKDLIEQLVGDLEEEDIDKETNLPHIIQINENTWKIHGNIELVEIEKATGVMINSEEYDTFTGIAFNILEQIPDDGSHKIELEIDALRICISKVKDHQVSEAIIQIKDNKIRTESELHSIKE